MSKRTADLSRRRFLAGSAAALSALRFGGLARAAGTTAAAAPVCALIPEQELGPFFLDESLLRSDITEGKKGVRLQLRIALQDARTCAPIANAAVDLWQCDAHGLYSGFTKTALGPPPAMHPSDKLTFLRGAQITGADGAVEFRTLFPGFYRGRVNHIHFKVRTEGRAGAHRYDAGHTSHVGQVFFPEELAAELMRHPPYSEHKIHRTTAAEDGIFSGEHGELSTARLKPLPWGPGYRAELTVAIDPTATPAPVGMRGPPPPA